MDRQDNMVSQTKIFWKLESVMNGGWQSIGSVFQMTVGALTQIELQER